MRRISGIAHSCATCLLVLAVATPTIAQSVSDCELGEAQAFLDVNGVQARIPNTGSFFRADTYGEVSYTVPAGSQSMAMWNSDLLLVGRVNGSLRGSTGGHPQRELWPGPIVNGQAPADCAQYDRVYRVSRREIEVFERNGEPTPDLRDWPVDLGAPVVDGDGIEGNYNLQGGDRPRILGDQTIWFISNDLGNEHVQSNTEPLGVEVRGTAFAASSPDSSVNFATFYTFEITNASGPGITDMYAGMYVDADVGNLNDDYVGSDTALGLAYAYNSDDFDQGPWGYGDRPAAVGYLVMEGVDVSDDSLDNDGDQVIDEPDERLEMTNFMWPDRTNPTIDLVDPPTASDFYNYMRTRRLGGEPVTYGGYGHDADSHHVQFMFPGDPPEYWSEEDLDSLGTRGYSYDRRFIWSMGPFRVGVGQTKSFTVAVIWARGSDRLASVRLLKKYGAELRETFREGLPVVSWGTPSVAPSLSSPADGVSLQPTNPVLAWRGVELADAYELEVVGTDTTWDAVVKTGAFPTDPPSEIVVKELSLLSGELYHWRVRALNPSGYGPWSPTWTFSTGEVTLAPLGPLRLESGDYAFVQVAGLGDDDACGPLAQSTEGCDEVGGNAVYGSRNGRNDWIMSNLGAGPEEALSDFVPHDFEIRVTEGGSYAYFNFSSGNVIWVPFEAWDVGVVGPFAANDSSDDIRLIPVLFSDGGGECYFGFGEGVDSFGLGWPYTDRIYAYYPTVGNTYADWRRAVEPLVEADPDQCPTSPLTDAAAELIDGFRGRPLQRLIFMMDPESPDYREEMIPVGNVIRFLTTKPPPISLAAPANGGIVNTLKPRLWWNVPPGIDSVRVLLTEDSGTVKAIINRWVHGHFVDPPLLEPGGVYQWRVQYRSAPWSATWSFSIPPNVSVDDTGTETPTKLSIASVFPNPIESRFTVSLGMPIAGSVEIVLYDALGRRVGVLKHETVAAGWQHLSALRPESLAPGVYFLKVSAAGQTVSRPVVML